MGIWLLFAYNNTSYGKEFPIGKEASGLVSGMFFA
jgi:hypothetical protein